MDWGREQDVNAGQFFIKRQTEKSKNQVKFRQGQKAAHSSIKGQTDQKQGTGQGSVNQREQNTEQRLGNEW